MPSLTILPTAIGIGSLSISLLVFSARADPVEREASAALTAVAGLTGTAAQQGLYQVPYNGYFTFTRIRYNSAGSSRGGSNAWNHDYPAADRHMNILLGELTDLRTNTSGSNVVDLEDPRVFQHPIIYMSEPGFWRATDEGIENLRAYLLKGGFLIFDDFEDTQWNNMARELARALPDHQWFELKPEHPIFSNFYGFVDIYVPHPLVNVRPNYQAIYEENDPAGRMLVLANHNSDLGEYWEWSERGNFGMAPTNDAYRLGVNYIIYALTH
jgi:hypothetical protein